MTLQQQIRANGYVPRVDDGFSYDFILANVGDAALVGEISNRSEHGIGTDKEGQVIRW